MVFFSVRSKNTQACEHKKNWESKKYCICRQTISNEHNAEQSAICLGNKTPELLGSLCPILCQICVLKYLFFVTTTRNVYPPLFCKKACFQRQAATIYGFHLASSSMPKSGGQRYSQRMLPNRITANASEHSKNPCGTYSDTSILRIYEGSTLVNQVMRNLRPGRKQTNMRWVRGVTDSEFCVTSNGWNLETSSAHVWPCFNIATWRTERMSFKNPVSKNNRSKKSIILTQAIYIPNIEKTLCLHKHVINNFHTFKNFLHPVESTPSYHNPRLYRLHPLGTSAAWIRWLRMAKRRIRWG